MTENLHIEVTIPKDWTGIQAKIVWQFLESLMDAIWDVHGDQIQESIQFEESVLQNASQIHPGKTDDFPF
jgi:hypothetical protein